LVELDITPPKSCLAYPSIEQFRSVIAHEKRQASYRGLDEEGNAIYEPLASLPTKTYFGTVKLHGCFEKNTLVTLQDGYTKTISNIKVGDLIRSWNIELDKEEVQEVLSTSEHLSRKTWLELQFSDRVIKCTSDHKFYTKNRGWVEAKDLLENDTFIHHAI
jgi:hypothetical protein